MRMLEVCLACTPLACVHIFLRTCCRPVLPAGGFFCCYHCCMANMVMYIPPAQLQPLSLPSVRLCYCHAYTRLADLCKDLCAGQVPADAAP